MKKVILNKCYGGFSLSEEAHRLYAMKKGFEVFAYKNDRYSAKNKQSYYKKLEKNEDALFKYYFTKDFGNNSVISSEDYAKYSFSLGAGDREDKTLIEVVEELGEKSNSPFSSLVVVEIPDDLEYVIDDYDGIETLHQKVQEW